MRQILKLIPFLAMIAMLCSCASVSMVDTWRNPDIRPARLQKVLVVSITKNDASRRVYEEMLAGELSRQGVQAVPSHTVLNGDRASWKVLEAAMKQVAAQAVLTVQTIKVEQETVVQPGTATYPGHWYPPVYPSWDLYGYYGSLAHYGPAYISTYDVATMQVNLFDAATGKLVWAATVESSEPEKVTQVGQDLARAVVKQLSRQGLI